MAGNFFFCLASGFKDLSRWIFNVFPLLSFFPRTATFVPGPTRIFAGRHIEYGVGEALIALKYAGWKIGFDRRERRGELLEVRDLACHQEA